MTVLRFATVADLAALLRRKRVSALELAREACELLAREGPRFNAVAAVTLERALAAAVRADRRLARGDAPALAGIPYGAKDLVAARGAPTTWGAPPYRDRVIDRDATVVARLERAGAVLAAKLAMVELAGGGGYRYPSASLQGPGRNPWDLGRWSGGSSSGSGPGVPAGLVPFAIGSETSGSIGSPASFCGVTGLRPSYGLVSRAGAMPLSWTLDKLGPMAHTAEDCALVLEAIAGRDPLDESTGARRFRPLDRRGAAAALRGVRVGFADEDLASASEPAKRALERGVRELRRLAPRVSRALLPADLPYGAMVTTIIGAEAGSMHAALIEGDRFEELVDARQKAGLRAGLAVGARDYLQAMRLRTVLREAFRRIFAEVDVLLSVGRTSTAPPIDAALDRLPPGTGSLSASGVPTGNLGLIPAGNLAGLPAIFFPCGLGTDGLPVGLQLVGPPRSEPLLVALAAAYQRETGHHLRRPTA